MRIEVFHTVTHTSRPSPSSCLFRFFTIELSVISKKHIKPLRVKAIPSCSKPLFKARLRDIDMILIH